MASTFASHSATRRSTRRPARCGDCTIRPRRMARPSSYAAPAVRSTMSPSTFGRVAELPGVVRRRAERREPPGLVHPGGLRPRLPDAVRRQRGALSDVDARTSPAPAAVCAGTTRHLGSSGRARPARPDHVRARRRLSGLRAVSRVLVTGATGFIGRGTLEPLLDAGMEVHAVSSRGAPPTRPAGVHWHVADLLAPGSEASRRRSRRPTSCTWPGTPSRAASGARRDNLDWLAASLRLIRAFAEAGGRRLVMAAVAPNTSGATNALRQEEYPDPAGDSLRRRQARAQYRGGGVSPARPGSRWPGDGCSSYSDPTRTRRGWPVPSPARLSAGKEALCSRGEQVRDFLYAPELAAAFVALLLSDVTGPVNMASGAPLRVRDLIEAIARRPDGPSWCALGARPSANEPARLTADVTPAARRGGLDAIDLAGRSGGANRGVVASAAAR